MFRAPAENKSSTAAHVMNSLLEAHQPEQILMVDLHGFSVEKAKKAVIARIKDAPLLGQQKIRFVTGRGNHVNAQGERGTLYKNFKEWLKEVEGGISHIQEFDGYYEIDVKSDMPIRDPFRAFLNNGVKEYLKDNFETIKANSEKGDTDDLLPLAICYDNGLGTEP
ncbi:MAG TPA: Smr/MutS family protein, partial [Gammaproteobacteria bacterium]|nr:Smr/MutS family protein [Gammaproteobacteria bacterium]